MAVPRADKLVCEYCVIVERSLPVNDYRMGGVHLWPFVRNLLYGPLVLKILPEATAEARERIARRCRDLLAELGLPRPRGTDAIERIAPLTKPGGHMLFFTRPVEHSGSTSSGFYSPILDPWVELALETTSAAKVEFINDQSLGRQARRHPTLMLPHPTQARFREAEALLRAEGLAPLSELLLRLADFSRRELLVDIGAELNGVAMGFLSTLAYKLEFAPHLRMLRPRALALLCYYYTVGMGVVWACREEGVRSIELQHGANGDHHSAYSHWTAVPAEGYAGLPDVFMTWGGTSADHIRRWWPRDANPHRVVVGGRPDLTVAAGLDTNHAAAAEVLGGLKARYRRVVMIALAAESIEPLFADIIVRAPRDWLWLVRCHPRTLEDKIPGGSPDDVQTILAGRGLDNFETRIASRAFLATVLPYVDHLVAHESSSWMEAAAFGVATTFIASQAPTVFATAVEERRVYYVETVEELFATIEQGPTGLDAAGPSIIVSDPALARRALARALGEG